MDEGQATGSNGRRLSPLFTWRTAVARSDLRSTAKLVAFALSLFMSEAGDSCFPSHATLAEHTSLSISAVKAATRTLGVEGWLTKKPGRGRGNSTRYTATTPNIKSQEETLSEKGHESEETVGSASEKGHVVATTTPIPRQGTTPSRARARDELFDALAVACGFRLDAMTKEASRLCAIATAELRRVGVTPAMIPAAVATYQRIYNGAATTPKAIANHWPRIAPKPRAAVEVCPDCGVGVGQHVTDCPSLTST